MRRISRPCYDKVRRCPGWAGGGWKYAKVTTCPEESNVGGFWGDLIDRTVAKTEERKPWGYLPIDYDSRWWKWKFHTCPTCNMLVLPYMVRWTSWRSWWYEIKYARNSWMWLIRLETWWGKKRGWW